MKTEVTVNGITFKNPVLSASGTFGMGLLYRDVIERLGGFITKAITYEPRKGNPYPRLYDGEGFIINSIGLENQGVFTAKQVLENFDFQTQLIANVAGESIEEYRRVVEVLNPLEKISIFEVNLSCPNVESGRMFSQDLRLSSLCIREIKKITDKPIWAKISGMGIDPVVMVGNLLNEGVDGITVMNTLPATVIDIEKPGFYLGGKRGGLSGPPLKHISLLTILRIREKYNDVVIIGSGGVMEGKDVIEYLMCGASLVEVGSASILEPEAPARIVKEFREGLDKLGIKDINNIIGKIEIQED